MVIFRFVLKRPSEAMLLHGGLPCAISQRQMFVRDLIQQTGFDQLTGGHLFQINP